MKNWVRWLIIACSMSVIVTSMGCIIMTDGDSSITIINDSDYVIEFVYVSPSDSRDWGPDLLGGDVLYPGESITIDGLDCDWYDVKVVDEYHVECVLEDEYLCFGNDNWWITNYDLDSCAW